ncbi:MAG: pheromone autoinducer 2 transporter [Chloroflexi bacterium ADurb.Bin325]|nr:MAG: pheromone autoinducer 2 transporter [Chloroflexi bacterium ADurb.Bin325]
MSYLTPARRNRLLLVLALILIVLLALWAARDALFPYILALALAYILLPVVNRLELWLLRVLPRPRACRALAILLTYLLAIGLFIGFFQLVVPIIIQQFRLLWDSREVWISGGERLAADLLEWYYANIPADIQARVAASLQDVAAALGRALQAGVRATFSAVTGTISFMLGLIVIPFWLFYVLFDQSKAMRGLVSVLPARWRADFLNVVRIADNVMGAYLRGQLLLCLFIGVIVTIALSLLGVQFPAVLGLLAGTFEILPFIGPILGLVPAVIVAAIQDPLLAVWTLIVFLAIQQVENIFLVPRISGKAVELHPAVIMVVLVIGNQVAGLWGMLLAVPLTAILRDLFKYLYLRSLDEPLSPKKALAALSGAPIQLDV